LTTLPFNLLAPFMIMVVSFAAFQATRDLMDLAVLFLVGVLGILLKRFGWSRPAFLIGFVLAPQAEGYLNLAVQFYGWQMLSRPGVVIIFALGAVSVWLGMRGGRTDTEALAVSATEGGSRGGPAADRQPQLAFLVGLALAALYAVWSSAQLSPLGRMFPLGVAAATLLLCGYLVFGIAWGGPQHPLNFDAEAGAGAALEPMGKRLWPNVAWFALLTAATALLGFVLATLTFFIIFLRTKAKSNWRTTLMLSFAAVAILAVLTNALLVELPAGLLQDYVPRPWPFR
jgi:hypothetical protein